MCVLWGAHTEPHLQIIFVFFAFFVAKNGSCFSVALCEIAPCYGNRPTKTELPPVPIQSVFFSCGDSAWYVPLLFAILPMM